MKRGFIVLTALLVCATAFAAGAKEGAAAAAPYTIQGIFPGDTPIDFDMVLREAEKRMAGTVNVKLDFTFIPWSDYGDKVKLKFAGGDAFDLHLNAPWLHMNELISQGVLEPWDDLLKKSAPGVKAKFPPNWFEANTFNGKIMGIPLGNTLGLIRGVYIRKDLRVKYGLKKPETFAEYETYLRTVAKNEPGIIPLSWEGSKFSMEEFFVGPPNGLATIFGQNTACAFVYEDAKGIKPILPIYEDPATLEWIQMVRRWYVDGLVDPDVLSMNDEKGAYNSGRLASAKGDAHLMTPVQNVLAQAVPGAETEFVHFYGGGFKPKIPSDFKQWNYLCLNVKSRSKETVAKFIEWIYADHANYDLLQLGIKGKHWVDTGNMTYDYPPGVTLASSYNFPGYVLLFNPLYDRDFAKALAEELQWKKVLKDPQFYTASRLMGFNANYDAIKTEIAQVSAVWPEVVYPLVAGVVDPAEGIAKAKKALEAAGYLKIVEEARRQIQAHLGRK
jgi:putative aldouronate transport system substrate-binding protein